MLQRVLGPPVLVPETWAMIPKPMLPYQLDCILHPCWSGLACRQKPGTVAHDTCSGSQLQYQHTVVGLVARPDASSCQLGHGNACAIPSRCSPAAVPRKTPPSHHARSAQDVVSVTSHVCCSMLWSPHPCSPRPPHTSPGKGRQVRPHVIHTFSAMCNVTPAPLPSTTKF